MSTAAAGHSSEPPKGQNAQLQASEGIGSITDNHPLVMIVTAGAIAAIAAVTFIGSVIIWLSVRHYGVLVF